jgi:GAF domain-containing protein
MPSSDLLAAVREFTTTILNPYDLDDLLDRLTDHAMIVTGSQGAGVMLAGQAGLGFAAASDSQVVEVEMLQDRVETGACHEAFTTRELVIVEDLATTDRWPVYRDRALELGFGAVMGVPMHACGETIGVLNLYRRKPGPWSEVDVEAAEILTSMGAGYVLHANQLRAQHDLAAQLEAAIASRDLIGQAKGLLIARHGLDAEAAFAMLRAESQATNLKLRDVAAKLLDNARATSAR